MLDIKILTQRFRSSFIGFDFSDKSIDILLELIDIVIDLMIKVDYQDNTGGVKKISSFLKLLSSDYCQENLDIEIIQSIYYMQISPILDYLDKKYNNYNPKNLLDGDFESDDSSSCIIKLDIRESNGNYYITDEIDAHNLKSKLLSPKYINSVDNKTIFDIFKSVSKQLLYRYYVSTNYDSTLAKDNLNILKVSTTAMRYKRNKSVRDIALAVNNQSKLIYGLIDKYTVPICETSDYIDLTFDLINDLKYIE